MQEGLLLQEALLLCLRILVLNQKLSGRKATPIIEGMRLATSMMPLSDTFRCLVWYNLSATPPHLLHIKPLWINICGTVADNLTGIKLR